ncbi:MAG: hypothetical protein JW798_18455 [Prolixibacteraceae bacterium]|nr:hypothetical protein [Prolixibacteraceae bacterium]
MNVYIVGEDQAAREIIKRLLSFCSDDFNILMELPARGGEIKKMLINYNTLSLKFPVILLMDLDDKDCAPVIINQYFKGNIKNTQFILNIAIDEVEAWLMADRENFANYYRVPITSIPEPKLYRTIKSSFYEMYFPYKSSLFMVKEIIPLSKIKEFKEQMIPSSNAKKGKEYNTALTPFIKNHWNIKNAMNHSDSLYRMINRIKKIVSQYQTL